jgi:hypothetical protein
MLAKEAVNPALVTTQCLHDLQLFCVCLILYVQTSALTQQTEYNGPLQRHRAQRNRIVRRHHSCSSEIRSNHCPGYLCSAVAASCHTLCSLPVKCASAVHCNSQQQEAHQKVMQLIPFLCEMHQAQAACAPPTNRLIQMQARCVAEVWHARHRLKEPAHAARHQRVALCARARLVHAQKFA